jgi:hypothetical protein
MSGSHHQAKRRHAWEMAEAHEAPAAPRRSARDADRWLAAPGIAILSDDAQPLRRRTAVSADPLGGQGVPAAVADVLRRRSGRGAPLPESTRTSMSEQFGVDFSSVRIHNDAESHDVAAAVQSVAFTHGRDIYFSRGSYRPDSASGQHVLAHELAHVATPEPARGGPMVVGRADDPAEAKADAAANRVVGQLRRSHQPSTRPQPTVAPVSEAGTALRRLTVTNTQWEAATSAQHSAGGGIGVMIMRDSGTPVVVKAGEDFLDESAVAAKLLTTASRGRGGWSGSAPDARPVRAPEAKRIKAKLDTLLTDAQKENSRTKNFLTHLDANKGVMVFGFAPGQEAQDALANTEQTATDDKTGAMSLREDSISYMLINDPGLLRTFGRASASDILLGNNDRFVGKINLENVMVDTVQKSISLIDNVEANDGAVLRDMPGISTGEGGFRFWAAHPRSAKLGKGDFTEVASDVIENLGLSITGVSKFKKAERDFIRQAYRAKEPMMRKWFEKGLKEGAVAVREALRDPVALTASVSDENREQVMTNLLARRYFLKGMSVDKAWREAVKEAQRLAAKLPKAAPARPTGPTPQTAPGRPSTPAPGGNPAPAQQRAWQNGRRWRSGVVPQQ